MSLHLNLSQRVLIRKRPTSSHISALLKMPIVSSNMLLVFFTQVVLSNRRNFWQCMMMLMSWSVIEMCVVA